MAHVQVARILVDSAGIHAFFYEILFYSLPIDPKIPFDLDLTWPGSMRKLVFRHNMAWIGADPRLLKIIGNREVDLLLLLTKKSILSRAAAAFTQFFRLLK